MTYRPSSHFLLFSSILAISQLATVVYAASSGNSQNHLAAGYSEDKATESLRGNMLVAQIIPDNTLGLESSSIIKENSTERINGGAIRGESLFHSFEEFNINPGQQVYFINPDGIEMILSRVTGSNPSEIDGLLGIDGPANLYFLNPNGITFGPNAQLDIRGAFTASTAGSIEFTDGSVFSAASPQGTSLLTMSVPLGVQFSGLPQGDINNTGNLETGGDLTLLGNQLYLEGQLSAGNNLTLQAQDAVTIRDTETDAFIARSGNDLIIQGNESIDIWTLQHLEQTPFLSGGDLRLISDGEISADAHFESGGGLQFLTLTGTPGNFISLYDPIIFANGDVVFGNYEGAALKVEATGSIQAGNIRITGPDTTLTPDGSGSDEDLLASSSAAILRAGVETVGRPNIPQESGGTSFNAGPVANQPPGSIAVNIIDTTSVIDGGDGGPIILEADGDITTGENLRSFSRSDTGNAGNGGPILISSLSGNILIDGRIASFSQARRGDGNASNGGNISISSRTGNITTNDRINAFSLSQRNTIGNAGNAGNISISSISGDLTINERLNAFSEASAGRPSRGGDISISSITGNITTRGRIDTNSTARNDGGRSDNGGNISISSRFGDIATFNNLVTFSESFSSDSGNGGDISISSETGDIINNNPLAAFSISRAGNAGNGGNINLSSVRGNISTETFIRSFSFVRQAGGKSGNGGDISFISRFGNISANGRLSSFSSSASSLENGGSGNGGDIFLSSNFGDISTNRIDSSSTFYAPSSNPVFSEQTGTVGNGGNISIFSEVGDITNNNTLFSGSVSRNGDVGRGGDISVRTVEGTIFNNDNRISTVAASEINEDTGAGGNVTLQASRILDVQVSTVSSGDASGNVTIQGGNNDLTISNLNLVTSGQLEVINPVVNDGQRISLELSDFDQSGEVFIISNGDLNLNNVQLLSDANRSADAGNVSIISRTGNIQLDNSQILSNTNTGSSGSGGNVLLESASSITLETNSRINTNTDGGGTAGGIRIRTPLLNLQNGAQITAATNSPERNGIGGSIRVNAETITLADADTEITVSTNGPANAGSISLEPFNSGGSISVSSINNEPQISASTTLNSSGNGGSIIIRGDESVTLDNALINTNTDGIGRAGSIRIRTPLLNLQNGAQLTAATNSLEENGDGGDFDIAADVINLSGNETEISVSTNGLAKAGNITLRPLNSGDIIIATITDGPQFSASTTRNSNGQGGNIILRDADLAILRNTSLVTGSDGSGDAGSIIVENVDVLLLRQGSLIQAGASANGNGGDIDIDANLVLTVPDEDNDILADTNTGTGGNIDITTERILGFREVQTFSNDLRGNGLNDISAQSERGGDGEVSINNLAVDPNQGLSELPIDVVDPSNQIAQGCNLANNNIADSQVGDFIITGRGGQPLSPMDIASEDLIQDDLGPETGQPQSSAPIITSFPHQEPVLLADAQEAVVTESGDVFLMAEGSWLPSISCSSLR
ncbi:filamentous hemagglutinin N-terminal domain-containing protein [Leptothoe sp. EHU-05/26/07-4]